MRSIILICLLVWPNLSFAAFNITASGCLAPGQSILISGGGFSARPDGQIKAVLQSQSVKLKIQNWSRQKIRVSLPKRGLKLGQTYTVVWNTARGSRKSLGGVSICANNVIGRSRAPRDVVLVQNSAPEYIVLVTTRQSRDVINALQGQNATLIRTRTLPRLNHTMLFFSFPRNLGLPRARNILLGVAPNAALDFHHIYSFASTPRLYATSLIGDNPKSRCSLQRPVRVGIIDGSVNKSHPALARVSIVRNSVIAEGERAAGVDHGTAVAGLIAGQPSGGSLSGFAIGARIFAAEAFARVKGREGARLENIAAGIDWLLRENVRIVNMSMSGSTNRAFGKVLTLAKKNGMIVVAAVGNNHSSKPRYPASSDNTIAVTAVDARSRIYRQANSGSHVEFAAPGVDIYVAKGKSGAGYQSGTSYAAPIVTALVARQAARGKLSLKKVRHNLKRKAQDLGPVGRDPRYGYGLIQTDGC